jgi:hypothetical protein
LKYLGELQAMQCKLSKYGVSLGHVFSLSSKTGEPQQ